MSRFGRGLPGVWSLGTCRSWCPRSAAGLGAFLGFFVGGSGSEYLSGSLVDSGVEYMIVSLIEPVSLSGTQPVNISVSW